MAWRNPNDWNDPRKQRHLERTYNRHVPASAQYFYGQNVKSPIALRQIFPACRIEQGNTFWTPIRGGTIPSDSCPGAPPNAFGCGGAKKRCPGYDWGPIPPSED